MRSHILVALALGLPSLSLQAADDKRQLVDFPEHVQQHMLANMRDHLVSLDEIMRMLAENKLDKAAEVAEQRLGMTSLTLHGADHLARMMPQAMQILGTKMHSAASEFALKAQEGDVLKAYQSLQKVTASCVACHASYRIR